jgi:flavin reductase (DIM6/NTAB) family NADH-FMN oxidoreductase RutF
MKSEKKPKEREVWKPGTMVYPVPAALISCGSTESDRNLLTVSWIGTICTNPAMLSISVRPERHSHPIICRDMEFTVNLTTVEMCRATDWCGVKSGADYDKWKECGLTPVKGVKNSCYYVDESPLAIECRVKDIISLGSHDLFIAEVLDVLADKSLIDPETGAFDLRSSDLVAYCHGGYYALGELLGRFGYSVKKKK